MRVRFSRSSKGAAMLEQVAIMMTISAVLFFSTPRHLIRIFREVQLGISRLSFRKTVEDKSLPVTDGIEEEMPPTDS